MTMRVSHHIIRVLAGLSSIMLVACSRVPAMISSPPGTIPGTSAVQTSRPPTSTSSDKWTPLLRPLHVPGLAAGARCPITPEYGQVSPDFGPATGRGPIYAVGIGGDGVIRGFSPSGQAKILWISRPEYQGAVLIRGERIDSNGRLFFQEGTEDSPKGELRLQDAVNVAQGWRNWPSYTIISTSGCYAYQIDGDNFSEVIVFQAIP